MTRSLHPVVSCSPSRPFTSRAELERAELERAALVPAAVEKAAYEAAEIEADPRSGSGHSPMLTQNTQLIQSAQWTRISQRTHLTHPLPQNPQTSGERLTPLHEGLHEGLNVGLNMRPKLARRSQGQWGGSQVGNILSLLLLALLIYAGAKTGPLFLERYRIDSLAQKAANQWMNVTPNLEIVKRDLQLGLEQQHIKRVGAEDFDFIKVTDREVVVTLDYSVQIAHPRNIVKPTVLKFHIERRSIHRVDLSQ